MGEASGEIGNAPTFFNFEEMAGGESKRIKVRQLQRYDCGAACLASVAGWYGVYLPLMKIRYLCGCTEEGISVKGILDGAQKMGFYARAYKSPQKSMEFYKGVNVPAIAHIVSERNMLHFVTLYGLKGNRVRIMDPATGEVKMVPLEEFTGRWTGIIIFITPGNDFKKSGSRKRGRVEFYRLLAFHKKEMILLLAGSLAIMITGIFYSILLQQIIDNAILPQRRGALMAAAVILVAVTLLVLGMNYAKEMLSLRTGIRIDCRLVVAYLRKLLAMPLRFFMQYKAGDLNSRLADSFKIREILCDGLISIVVNCFALLCSIAIMFFYNSRMALLILLYIPLYILLFYISKAINRKYNKKLAVKGAEMESDVISCINSIETVKYYNSENLALEKMERSYSELAELFHNGGRAVIGFNTAAESLSRTLMASVLVIGGFYSLNGDITAGELVSFYTLCGFFTAPLNALIAMNTLITEADVSMERLFEILDADDEHSGRERWRDKLPSYPCDIQIRGLSFSYPGREEIFKELSLTLEGGSFTLIVGESGCGKSTLISLITGEYPISNGEILIGGCSVTGIKIRELREYMTVVPQKATLLNCSLLQNIAPVTGESNVELVENLCKRLKLDHLIQTLPFGLNTNIMEMGIKLSGGEVQRIAIARAIFRDTPVYLFDEPTTSVDDDNKEIIINEINLLKQRNRSVIVVTHDTGAFYSFGKGIDKIIRIFKDKSSAHSEVKVCTP